MIPFGDRLAAAMDERGPLCVGIDPHPDLLQAWGLEDSAESLRTFTTAVYEGCAPYAAALKPQVALFERHGSAGLAVLEELFARAAEDRVLIVADAKRGDIGSTMKAYADAWLGTCSPLGTDSVTLSPYLGFESLRPALDAAAANQRGTFVLALTSNPEGKSVQHVGKTEDTGAVAKQIIAAATAENTAQTWERMGSCGLVVGALKRHHVTVVIGLVLGSIAPILYGSLVEGGNVWLHHGVRAVLASGIMALWYLGWMRK